VIRRLGAIVLAALLGGAPAAPAQVNVTIQPFMTQGPPTAPVTIVEFSDYQ
jgi:protein-disulfide isomerase